MDRLKGQIAFVTGSSRGIGAAIAKLFAHEGATVAIQGRDESSLEVVQNTIERDGGSALSVVGDLTSFEDIETMRRQIEALLGPITTLIANAGGSYTMPGPIEDTPEKGWRASIDGNLTTTFLSIKAVLPGMKKRGAGSIVTISSAAGHKAHPQAPIPYSAAKAGIEMLTRNVATQAGPYGVRVNCVAPGTILTERNRQRIPEEQQIAMKDWHPIRRLGTPDDVAHAALYLASEEASWVTGIVLDVAGGAVL